MRVRIIDKISQYPLINATVVVMDTDPVIGFVTVFDLKMHNGNYTLNTLVGKEFKLGKNNILSFDLNLTTTGGRRYTPYDVEETISNGEEVLKAGEEYSLQYDPYFRLDTRVAFKLEGKKISQE